MSASTQPARPPTARPPGPWHRGVSQAATALWFSRIRVRQAERLPATGPVLYLGLHRNGAVDGLVYHRACPRAVFLISVQLVRHALGRLFFTGLPVARVKDPEDSARNPAALAAALDLLNAGGELFILPEGTSSLGPRPLPFKGGAFKVALDHLDRGGPPLQLVPLGIHYERGWAFRGQVEIVVGRPRLLLSAPRPVSGSSAVAGLEEAGQILIPPDASPLQRLRTLKQQVRTALAEVGVSFPDATAQQRAERLALTATLGTNRSWFAALKHLEPGPSPAVLEADAAFAAATSSAPLRQFHGVPGFPLASPLVELIALIPAGLVILAGMLLNLPPLLAGWWAGRKFPDGRNVIALWRLLIGLPCFVSWWVGCGLAALLTGHFAALAAGLAITLLALALYRGVKRRLVAVYNWLRCPAGRSAFFTLRRTLQDELDAPTR